MAKSSAKLSVVQDEIQAGLRPPDDYTAEHAQHWRGIVASKPDDWWDAATIPLLDAYCRAIVEHHRICELIESGHPIKSANGLNLYKELHKIRSGLVSDMKRLAAGMRLTQQSRYTPYMAGQKSKPLIEGESGGKGKFWDD